MWGNGGGLQKGQSAGSLSKEHSLAVLSQGLWVEDTRYKKHEHKHVDGRNWTRTVRIGGQPQDSNNDVQRATSVAKQAAFPACASL